ADREYPGQDLSSLACAQHRAAEEGATVAQLTRGAQPVRQCMHLLDASLGQAGTAVHASNDLTDGVFGVCVTNQHEPHRPTPIPRSAVSNTKHIGRSSARFLAQPTPGRPWKTFAYLLSRKRVSNAGSRLPTSVICHASRSRASS